MKISKFLVAGLASTCLTVSAMAEVANPVNTATPSTEAIANNHLNTADLNYAFGDSQDLQVQAMTQQEMDETQGAVAPWVIGAGVGGVWQGANYAYGVYKGDYKWSHAKFAGNVATGAAIGGSFGAAGHIASGGAKFIPSLTNAGANMWRGNSAVANWGANHAWRR